MKEDLLSHELFMTSEATFTLHKKHDMILATNFITFRMNQPVNCSYICVTDLKYLLYLCLTNLKKLS